MTILNKHLMANQPQRQSETPDPSPDNADAALDPARRSAGAGGIRPGIVEKRQIRATLRKLFNHLDTEATKRREKYFQPNLDSIHSFESSMKKYREDLAALLGWPLNQPKRPEPLVQTEEIGQGKFSTVEKMRFAPISGVELGGLFFRSHDAETCPLVILIPGGISSPDAVVQENSIYNSTHRKLLERGISVFIPQILSWGEGQDDRPLKRHTLDSALKRYGSSLGAVEISNLQAATDYFVKTGTIKRDAVGIAGFSYGGFLALFAGALDTRYRAVAASGYLSAGASNLLPEASWSGFNYFFSDVEVAQMVSPRGLFLEIGQDDPVPRSALAERDAGRILEHYAELGRPKGAVFHVHEGGHELFPDERGIDFLESHLCD